MISEGTFNPGSQPRGSVFDQRERPERERGVPPEMTLAKTMAAVLAKYIDPGTSAECATETRPVPYPWLPLEGPVRSGAVTPGEPPEAPAGLTPEQLREALGRIPDPDARALLIWAACLHENTGRWAGPVSAMPVDGGS